MHIDSYSIFLFLSLNFSYIRITLVYLGFYDRAESEVCSKERKKTSCIYGQYFRTEPGNHIKITERGKFSKFIYLSLYPIYLSIYLSICISISIYPYILSIYLSIYLFIYLSIYLSVPGRNEWCIPWMFYGKISNIIKSFDKLFESRSENRFNYFRAMHV